MKNWSVIVQEIHLQEVEVEADTAEEAIYAVSDGEGDYSALPHFLETLDTDTWSVKELKKD